MLAGSLRKPDVRVGVGEAESWTLASNGLKRDWIESQHRLDRKLYHNEALQ
jgi:hypothetical protein